MLGLGVNDIYIDLIYSSFIRGPRILPNSTNGRDQRFSILEVTLILPFQKVQLNYPDPLSRLHPLLRGPLDILGKYKGIFSLATQ